ncbi:sigma-54 interaction domain-containing protein [Roseimaritima ulvae]|uniref:Nitrogen fixation protein VnfA n=1 Tax=Roseimaritima ulvae TaxID=980254 RepID=A0A5B9QTS3_9BACT|nr:sigma-54-dependent Fis family transcriptional regulator [Roseimaritima ulvae]QEG42418.1 Nitrogen fixation protein VnfA [Roseimaritima ulvae]
MNPDSNPTWQLLPALLATTAAPDATFDQATAGLLRQLVDHSAALAAGTVRQTGRDWTVTNWAGPVRSQPVPEAVVAEAVDRGQVQRQSEWTVIPLAAAAATAADRTLLTRLPQALLLQSSPAQSSATAMDSASSLTQWGQAAAELLTDLGPLLLRLGDYRQRCGRLEAMLDCAAQWHQEDDPEALLHAIANAATQLLQSERASIFLWDRARKKLVGKPALGVGNQPLEVDDSAGVVGAVLQSGQPRRWQASEDEEAEINRAVDRKLQFVTRSLLAVPLQDQAGKPAGVFEVINKKQGAFSHEDIDTLTRLASQAAGVIRNTQDRHTAIRSRDRLIADVADTVQIIGESENIAALRKTVQRVAATDLSLLILGENGTGKEVLARSVHFQSPRRSEPFVAVNCAALVESLLESELFGHEKGAFTDAHQARPGKFELAHGGTLFLDEIGDMSLGGQAKLLRVLEEKIIVRVGGSTPIPVDVRVVAATNQPLAGMVREKTFREDLYFRLNVVSLQLPPLRERGDDILLLAEHFLSEFAQQIGRLPAKLSKHAVSAMRRHAWSGNIRELRNLMERVSYLCPGDTIQVQDLSFSADPRTPTGSDLTPQSALTLGLSEATRRYQVQAIEQAIASCQGNMTDAAARLGLHRSNLYRKLKQLGMDAS